LYIYYTAVWKTLKLLLKKLQNKLLTFLKQQILWTRFLNCSTVTKTSTVIKGLLVIEKRWNLEKEKNSYHKLLRNRENYKSGNYSEEEKKNLKHKSFHSKPK